jgi:hypothetical protein
MKKLILTTLSVVLFTGLLSAQESSKKRLKSKHKSQNLEQTCCHQIANSDNKDQFRACSINSKREVDVNNATKVKPAQRTIQGSKLR